MNNPELLTPYDKLMLKIYAFSETIWREKWEPGIEKDWLNNFTHSKPEIEERERLNMLFLLSKFMYFGEKELRELLLSMYRDLLKYPIVSSIRKSNNNTRDSDFLNEKFTEELDKTRFLGVGNPSESGVHLLYYFRQENKLESKLFINASEILTTSLDIITSSDDKPLKILKSEIKDRTIKRYIFIDDFCGSGQQASNTLGDLIKSIKQYNENIEVNYFILFGTEEGIKTVRSLNVFDRVEAVFTIDDTFKTFSANSRYFKTSSINNVGKGINAQDIDKDFAFKTAWKYGGKLCKNHPVGYRDCQLLVGFHHNTPDNSLPIIWCEDIGWKPIFKRYNKK